MHVAEAVKSLCGDFEFRIDLFGDSVVYKSESPIQVAFDSQMEIVAERKARVFDPKSHIIETYLRE